MACIELNHTPIGGCNILYGTYLEDPEVKYSRGQNLDQNHTSTYENKMKFR